MSRARRAGADLRAVLGEAMRLQNAGRALEAIDLLRPHLRGEEGNADLLLVLGAAEARAGYAGYDTAQEALKHCARASQLRPRSVDCLYWLGVAQRLAGDVEGACASLRKVLDARPDWADVIGALADALLVAGRPEEALAVTEPALSPDADPMIRWAAGEAMARLERDDEAVALLERVGRDASARAQLREAAWFGVASVHDRAGREDGLFAAAAEAHRQRPMAFDAARFASAVDRQVAMFAPQMLEGAPTSGVRAERAVFIVGMPRSGTSLLEQILDAHPEIAGAGEAATLGRAVHHLNGAGATDLSDPMLRADAKLTPGGLRREANAMLDRLKRDAGKARFVTDKTPLHAFHLGPLQLLLPCARVINMLRDPRDVGLSYHTRGFVGLNPQAADLGHVGVVYNQYRRLMEYWKAQLDLPILDVRYENLVTENEREVRRVLEFLDLPFDDACLRSHETTRTTITASADQVRAPVHTGAIGKWRRYERSLRPLIETIDDRWLAEYE